MTTLLKQNVLTAFEGQYKKNSLYKETILTLLEIHSTFQPNKTAFIELDKDLNEKRTISFQQLRINVTKCALALKNNQLTNQRALLIYQNDINFITGFLACLAANVIAVPVYIPKSNSHSIRLNAIIEDCHANAILTTTKLSQLIKSKVDQIKSLKNISIIETDEVIKSTPFIPTKFEASNETAFLQYTSGSTSSPKGVMVTNDNILYNCKYIIKKANIHSRSINLSWLPNYHDMGLFNGFLVLIYAGVTSIIMNPMTFILKPENWLKAITTYNVTHSGGPNFAYDLCVEKIHNDIVPKLDLSSWICAFNGAENIKMTTLKSFSEKFKSAKFNHQSHFPCYGLAETTLMVTSCNTNRAVVSEHITTLGLNNDEAILTTKNTANNQEVVSTGTTDLDTKIKIVNPKTNEECNNFNIGEIWVTGPTVTKGYWNKEKETKKTFYSSLLTDTNTLYLRTGDLGFINSNNELFITGRIKEIIIINGKNYYPQDIESIIETISDEIMPHGSAAFQIDNNLIVAAEIKRTSIKSFDPNKTIELLNKAIKQEFDLNIDDIIFLSPAALPKTSSGKKQRLATKDGYLNNSLKVIKKIISKKNHPPKKINIDTLTFTEKNLKQIIESSLKIKNLDCSSSLFNLGINSLQSFEIITKINEFFIIDVNIQDFFNAETIFDIAKIIDKKQIESLSIQDINETISLEQKEAVLV